MFPVGTPLEKVFKCLGVKVFKCLPRKERSPDVSGYGGSGVYVVKRGLRCLDVNQVRGVLSMRNYGQERED